VLPTKHPVRAEPGVIVVLINEGCHAHRLEDPNCARNRDWRKVLSKWKAILSPSEGGSPSRRFPLFIYDWLIPDFHNEAWLRLPWQCPEWAVANLNLWQREGVLGVLYEAQSTLTAPNRWLMYYAIARRLWDENADAKTIRREACRKLFGNAAEPMERYLERLERAVAECQEHVRIWHLPDPKRVFTLEVIADCRRALEESLAKARDETVHERILREKQWFEMAMEGISG
jgi:hypothetical protein